MTGRQFLRAITDAFRAEFGKTEKKQNPWPQCAHCYHRQPPGSWCREHVTRTCITCCGYSGNHPKEDQR